MNTQTDNRRVRMTKRMMKDALMKLMESEKLGDISVTALCEAADVHRTTFYKHYTEPADLLREIEQDFLYRIPTPPKVLDQQNRELLLAETTVFLGKPLRALAFLSK